MNHIIINFHAKKKIKPVVKRACHITFLHIVSLNSSRMKINKNDFFYFGYNLEIMLDTKKCQNNFFVDNLILYKKDLLAFFHILHICEDIYKRSNFLRQYLNIFSR